MRGWLWLLPAGLVVAAAFLGRAPVRAQASDEEAADAREVHLGAGSCAAQACHGGAFEERQEYKTWAVLDKHAKAYDILGGELGRRIGRLLGIEPTSAPECLSCHGTVGVQRAATFDPHDGVGCELCHGGAREWLGPHAAPEWKEKTPAEKERLGLRDLTTPARRAALCVSCHVGGEGRDITHDIMAAGHPPLTFDAAKFTEDMPPHWEDEPDGGVALWVEGAKANAAAKLRQIARTARLGSARWPEFALFDCWGCHHPIYAGSVYERADPPGRPGDLTFDLAALEVLLVAAGEEGQTKRFQRFVGASHAPGGPRRELADEAARAAEDALRLLPEAEGYGRAEAERFLAHLDAWLVRVAEGGTRTPRAEMQQIAFALHALVATRESEAFAEAFAALDEALARPTYDAAACAALARAAIAAGAGG